MANPQHDGIAQNYVKPKEDNQPQQKPKEHITMEMEVSIASKQTVQEKINNQVVTLFNQVYDKKITTNQATHSLHAFWNTLTMEEKASVTTSLKDELTKVKYLLEGLCQEAPAMLANYFNSRSIG